MVSFSFSIRECPTLFNFKRSGTRQLMGVDISSAGIKLVQLSPHGRRWRLDDYVVRGLPDVAEGERGDKPALDVDRLTECLQQALSLLRQQRKEVAVAVAGPTVITRHIEMQASLSDAEMENQIVVEADQYIPYPLSEVALDFERQGAVNPATGMVSVLLAACRQETVAEHLAVIEAAGLEATVVDVEAFAIERACRLLQASGETLPAFLGVLDIGASTTTLHVLNEGRLLFTREQSFGGRQLLEQVCQHYGLSASEAGGAIRRAKLPADYEQELLPVFREQVADQINRALQFFFSSTVHNTLDALVLVGGVSALSGLAQTVGEETGFATTVADPFARQLVSERVNALQLANDAPGLMVACGLAMRTRP